MHPMAFAFCVSMPADVAALLRKCRFTSSGSIGFRNRPSTRMRETISAVFALRWARVEADGK
eukprot:6178709-Pleurochrysis_carterae.AAC.3